MPVTTTSEWATIDQVVRVVLISFSSARWMSFALFKKKRGTTPPLLHLLLFSFSAPASTEWWEGSLHFHHFPRSPVHFGVLGWETGSAASDWVRETCAPLSFLSRPLDEPLGKEHSFPLRTLDDSVRSSHGLKHFEYSPPSTPHDLVVTWNRLWHTSYSDHS